MERPDFYLASTEHRDFELPRRCWRIKRTATPKRDDLLLIRIDPPLPTVEKGKRQMRGDIAILAPQLEGASLFPIRQWPVYVHVARLLIDDPESRDELVAGQFESIAWAAVYPTEEEARQRKMGV